MRPGELTGQRSSWQLHGMRGLLLLLLVGCWSKPSAPPANAKPVPASAATAELGPVELAKFHVEIVDGKPVTVIDTVLDGDDGPPPPLDEMRALVKAQLGGLRACYVEFLARLPGATGTTELRVSIAADGAAQLGSVGGLDGFQPCLATAVTAWPKFPAALRERGYELRIEFAPSGGAAR
jgi:hypothetical protein